MSPPVARIARDLRLRHRPSKGDEPRTIHLRAGQEVEVVEAFAERALVRDEDGRLFTVARSDLEGAGGAKARRG